MRFKKFFGNLKDQLADSWQSLVEVERDKPTDPAAPPVAGPAAERPSSLARDAASSPEFQDPMQVLQRHDEATVRQREEQAARIQAMFGEYGEDICAYVYAQALVPGGAGRLVEKLGLESRGRDSADIAQVDLWIAQNSPDQFRDKVKIRRTIVIASDSCRPPHAAEAAPLKVKNFDPSERERVRATGNGHEKSQVKVDGPAPRPRAADPATPARPAPSHSRKVELKPVGLTHPEGPLPPTEKPAETRKLADRKPHRMDTPKPQKLPPKPAQQPPAPSSQSLLDKALENISKFDEDK